MNKKIKKEKEYIEPEIITGDIDEKIEEKTKEQFDAMEDQIKSIKNAILLKGISSLILPILIFILIIIGLISLIMWIFAKPFDYIISGIVLFLILRPVYKLIKMFK